MIPSEISANLERLSESYVIERGVTASLLSEAEHTLGYCLPEDVRSFAIEVGAIHRPSDSLAILFPGTSLEIGQGESAYRFTIDSRKNDALPSRFLVLDGRDYPLICLDVSDPVQGVFTFYNGRTDTKLASGFFVYLAEWIEVRLNEQNETA